MPAKDDLSLASSLLPENGDLSASKVMEIKIVLILKVFFSPTFYLEDGDLVSKERSGDLASSKERAASMETASALSLLSAAACFRHLKGFVAIIVKSTEFCLPWTSTMGSGKGGGAGKGEKHWLPSNPSLLCRSGHLNQIALSSHLQTQVLVSRPHPTKWQVPTWSLSAGWKGSRDIVPASSYMSSANGLADPQK